MRTFSYNYYVLTCTPLAGNNKGTIIKRTIPIYISTHTPLAGSDLHPWFRSPYGTISTHTPLAGSDRRSRAVKPTRAQFQPTLPLRGVTGGAGETDAGAGISTHTPLAGSDRFFGDHGKISRISIHTPLAGSDRKEIINSRSN